MRKTKKQIVIKIHGDYDLIESVLEILEQRTQGIVSKIMPSGTHGDYHAFITVFEVIE